MLRIAFASTDQEHVDMHFGASERFVIYDVAPGVADLVGVGEFISAVMKGENKDKSLPAGTVFAPGDEMAAKPGELDKPPEDKVIAKLDFLDGCAAVYAASIGTSSIKRLMAAGIQPVIVDNGHDILDLLNEVSLALSCGGLAWVDKAKAKVAAAQKSPDRFDEMEREGWHSDLPEDRRQLITSIDDLE
jgi:nitrogen fixation protein NifX